ncbi:MAG: type IV pilus modification PilV family protein [Candidatus Binatia bacterium]
MRAPTHSRLLSERGSSLLEIVVASSIFAFLVLSLSPSILNTQKTAALSGNSSIASTLALDKLDQLRGLDPSAGGDMAAGTWPDTLNPLRADGTTGGIFTRTWTVTDNTPEVGMKRVEMQVSWRDRLGQSAVSLVTLVLP